MSDLNMPGEDDGVLGDDAPADDEHDVEEPSPDISRTPPPPD